MSCRMLLTSWRIDTFTEIDFRIATTKECVIYLQSGQFDQIVYFVWNLHGEGEFEGKYNVWGNEQRDKRQTH